MPASTFHVCAQGHRWTGEASACPDCGGPSLAAREPNTLSAASFFDLRLPDDGQATLPQSEAPPLRPADVAGYVIERELGRGGMGVVYLARHVQLNRHVALKMILAGAHAGPQERERFHIEAQAAAQLQHPNIVQIYEVGAAKVWRINSPACPGRPPTRPDSLSRWLEPFNMPTNAASFTGI